MMVSRRTLMVSGVLIAALIAGSASLARPLSIEQWDRWNAVSTPIFPGKDWLRYAEPEDGGWSSQKLAQAYQTSLSAGSAAVLVIYDGAILAQWGETERRFMCHSVRKSLLSALYGPAVLAGDIDLHATIGSLGIEDSTPLTPTEKSATVLDLLTSRSGVYLTAALETVLAKNSRPERGSHDPGTFWYYNNWDFNVLATLFNQETGEDIFEAFKSRFADPLQMQDFDLRHTHYHFEPERSQHPGFSFRMSARDLARFGLLYLNQGRWQDAQIVSSEWVRESTKGRSVTSSGGYGYMWWTEVGFLEDLGTFSAYGYGGQAIHIVPGAKLVVVHRVNTYGGGNVSNSTVKEVLRQILDARIGPPRANPVLETASNSQPAIPRSTLTPAQVAALTGQYQREADVETVTVVEGHLELHSPRQGHYLLHPLSPTEFRIEDIEWRLWFTLDETGTAAKMRVWPKSGDAPYEYTRVP